MSNEYREMPPGYIRISASDNRVLQELGELVRYRDLVWLFVKREFTVKYKQTILGPLWIILQPLITSLMYLFIFGGIARIDTGGVPGILFYLGSNALWSYFAASLTANAGLFMANAKLFGKVYFPRLSVPIANTITAAIMFLIEMALFAVIYIWFAVQGLVSGSWLVIPVVFVLLLYLGMIALGFGIIISSLTTRYRDLSILVTFGVQLWMYGTPVVYPLSALSHPVLRTLVMINPVTMPMELYRELLFGSGEFVPWSAALSCVITAVVLIAGVRMFSRVEKTFIDTV